MRETMGPIQEPPGHYEICLTLETGKAKVVIFGQRTPGDREGGGVNYPPALMLFFESLPILI